MRLHFANALLDVTKVNLHVTALIVQQESEKSFVIGITTDVIIDGLTIVVEGAFVRKVEELADDLRETSPVFYLQELEDLRAQVFYLLNLDFRVGVVLNERCEDLAQLVVITIQFAGPPMLQAK